VDLGKSPLAEVTVCNERGLQPFRGQLKSRATLPPHDLDPTSHRHAYEPSQAAHYRVRASLGLWPVKGRVMTEDGRAIANFILDFCAERGRTISNLSLQKVVYFCHVWSLIKLRRPLVRHNFEAWQYGPVLQYLYRQFRTFENKSITGRATHINPRTGEKEVVPYSFDPETEYFLTKVVDFYTRIRASDLVELTHVRGGPWDEVWNHGGTVNPGMKIPEDAIIRFYSRARSPFSIQ